MPLCDPTKLVVGEWLSLTRYVRVDEINGTKIRLESTDGTSFTSDISLLKAYASAAQAPEETKVTSTELAREFEQQGSDIFTVVYRKKFEPNELADSLADGEDVREMSQAKRRKLIRDRSAGEQRTLIGHLKSRVLDEHGRIPVVDCVLNEDRLVDPRTIEQFTSLGKRRVRK